MLQCLLLTFDFHGNTSFWECLKNLMLQDLGVQLVDIVFKLTWRPWCQLLPGSVQGQVSQAGDLAEDSRSLLISSLKFQPSWNSQFSKSILDVFPPSFLIPKKLGFLSKSSHVSLSGYVDTCDDDSAGPVPVIHLSKGAAESICMSLCLRVWVRFSSCDLDYLILVSLAHL